jgi:hypothetical protein
MLADTVTLTVQEALERLPGRQAGNAGPDDQDRWFGHGPPWLKNAR